MAVRKLNDADKLANPERTTQSRGRGPQPIIKRGKKGPWFPARFGGECDTCCSHFDENDEIRADGQGGWECREWCGEDDE